MYIHTFFFLKSLVVLNFSQVFFFQFTLKLNILNLSHKVHFMYYYLNLMRHLNIHCNFMTALNMSQLHTTTVNQFTFFHQLCKTNKDDTCWQYYGIRRPTIMMSRMMTIRIIMVGKVSKMLVACLRGGSWWH